MDTTKAPRRRKTQIPLALNDLFQAKLEQRHDTGSYILKDIMRAAKRAIDAGIPLPTGRERSRTEPPLPDDPKQRCEVDWTQLPAEYEMLKADISAAGSSVRAVITAGIQAYVDDERVILPADWTPFPARVRTRKNS